MKFDGYMHDASSQRYSPALIRVQNVMSETVELYESVGIELDPLKLFG